MLADGELLFNGTPAQLKAQAQAVDGKDLEQAFVGFLKRRVTDSAMRWLC